MRWWFVRHGESIANRAGWISGWRDVPLTELGEQQARMLAPWFAGEQVDRLLASDLQRAWRTAELVLPGRTAQRIPELRERCLGEAEGRTRAELVENGEMTRLLGWSTAPTGGESQRDLAVRVLGWLAANEIDGSTLIVAHGGVLRVLEGMVLGVPRGKIGVRSVANTEVVTFDLEPGRWAELAELAAIPGEDDTVPEGTW